jgi:hypothetical protein
MPHQVQLLRANPCDRADPLSRAVWCLPAVVARLNNGNATLIERWNGSLVPSPAAL